MIFVAIFLMISGGTIYYNYDEINSVRQFYFKRWKSVFPIFYITFLYFYIQNVFERGAFFYNGNPWWMLLTVLGIDGFFTYRLSSYYIVGEWYFGAIVMIYALYPAVLKVVKKYKWKVLIVVIPVWIWQLESDWFYVYPTHNLIHCIALFIVGMLITRYGLSNNKIICVVSWAVSSILLFVPLPGTEFYKGIILSIALYFVLFSVGNHLTRLPTMQSMIAFLGGLTFPMYLIQNVVGWKLVTRFKAISTGGIIKTAITTIALCMIGGWCINAVTNAFLKAKWFLRLEKWIMGKNNL